MESKVGNTRANAKPQKCRQKERKTCLHSAYYTRVVHGSEIVYYAVLKKMHVTARETLVYRVLQSELYELENQERKDRKELAKKNEEPKEELEAAEDTTARLEGEVQGSSSDTERGMAETESNSGS